jgi:4-hydroxy-4-methyl-2-oxoglutarate aldolase
MTADQGRREHGAGQVGVGFRAFTGIERPHQELVQRLAAYAPPDLSDAMNGGYTVKPGIHPLYAFTRRIAGPATTVSVPRGANDVVRFAIDQAMPGDVLVINACGQRSFAVCGGNLTRIMQRRGLAGAVIDGTARDPEEAADLEFALFARGQATVAPPLEGTGEVNVPVACGGVVVNAGDIIVADANGIVAVPQHSAHWVLERVAELHERQVKLQPIRERGQVPNIAAVVDAMKRRGFVVHETSFERAT